MWETKPISQIAKVNYGYTAKASFDAVGPKFLRITDIQDNFVEWSTVPSCEISNEDFEKHKLYDDDIVFARTGATTGKSYLLNNPPTAIAASYLIRLRLTTPSVLASYVIKFFQTWEYWEEVNKGISGSAQGGFNASKLSNLIIPIPPLEEQKRIVGILDEAFEGIDQAIKNTEQNLQNARDLFESYLNNIFTQKGEGWVEKKLGDPELLKIIDGDRGTNYPKKGDFQDEGFCLFLNTKNVRPDGFNFNTKMFITKEKDALLRKGKLERRDVILTTRGTIGNIALYDNSVKYQNIRINSGMLIFRPNEKTITSDYLFEIFRSGIMKTQIKKHVSGAAQPQLPIRTLIDFVIPVPKSIKDQKTLVNNLQNLLVQTQRLEVTYQQKLAALKELKQSLLQKAFAGELTSRDREVA